MKPKTLTAQKVDVIIPTFNGLPYLKEAIQSVLAQTYKNLSLYVIDDGSTDGGSTAAYVKSLKNPRVIYASNPKKGRSAARNYGISLSDAPYIAFLDSDDKWQPSKLQKQLNLMGGDSKIGLVYNFCRVIDDTGTAVGQLGLGRRGNVFKFLLGGNFIPGPSSVLVPREVLNKVGTFREDLSMAEDWELWLRISRAYKIDYLPDFLSEYRVDNLNERKKFLEKAIGLEHVLPIMVKEFRLGPIKKARLATACLGQACSLYLDGGDKQRGRRALLRMLSYNPFAFLMLDRRQRLAVVRLLLGNRLLRRVRHSLRRSRG